MLVGKPSYIQQNSIKNKTKKRSIFTLKSSFHVVSFLVCSVRILNVFGFGQLSFLVTGSTVEQICCVEV
jgi:hypothetical protein